MRIFLLITYISIRSLASKKLEETSLPSTQRKQLTHLLSKLDVEISKQGVSDTPLKELSKQRGKDVVTRCFHKMGIVVPYDQKTELGYRPLPLTDSKPTVLSLTYDRNLLTRYKILAKSGSAAAVIITTMKISVHLNTLASAIVL